jgi:transcriptional regulator with XRE-family HTH domain
MQLADAIAEDGLNLIEVAEAIGASSNSVVRRYRAGERIPDRARMRAIVEFFEGRVTPNDIYGLTELIERLQQRRAARRAADPRQSALPLVEDAA